MHRDPRGEGCVPFNTHALVSETLLVQHVIGLVNNKDPKLRRVELAASDNIGDRAWRADDDVGLDGLTAGETTGYGGSDVEPFTEVSNGANYVLDLARELAAGGKSQRLGLLGLGEIDTREASNGKSGRLSGPRLGLGEEMLRRIAEHDRDTGTLDLGWLVVAQGEKTLQDLRGAKRVIR